jgi:hypothetical protein
VNNPYNLHSWSTQYREEALREAQRQHLLERGRAEGVNSDLWEACTVGAYQGDEAFAPDRRLGEWVSTQEGGMAMKNQ